MAYKTRYKKQKECPACNGKFYGYDNQIYCCPKHGYVFRKYGHISVYPPFVKMIEKAQKRIDEAKKK